ncbi:MAG: TldD/PmbA family protein [Clostridiales bacterium]|nr:TldD/PmbA family protein [Clostridiales bacterium]
MATGGDLAEIFLENTERGNIGLVNGLVEKANWGVDYGCGLRIIYGFSAVYAFTNKTDRASLINLAKDAAQAVKAAQKEEAMPKGVIILDRRDRQVVENRHSIATLPGGVPKNDIVERLRAASAASKAYDSLITQTEDTYAATVQDVCIVNSNGLWAEDRRVRTRVFVSAVASSENEKQTGYKGPGAMKGYEFVQDLDMEELGGEAARTAVTMLKADLCPSGRMPVLIESGFGGVIFHEACGHSLEATSVAKKASVFADKLGRQIASPAVTAIDDGLPANEWGSLNVDDEGRPTQKNVLIENGILKSFMVDYLNGLKMETPSTGSGRRESYKFAPTSRMTNTYIANGTEKPEAIIADTEYGLYAKQMGGGSVEPSTGDFNFAVVEGYMIREGKVAEPVRGATLIGKGSEVLMDIDRVADNLKLAAGMCGSVSGIVPTSVGQPLIRVKEMTVGGRK